MKANVAINLPASLKSKAIVKLACSQAASDYLQAINPVDGEYLRDCNYLEKPTAFSYKPRLSVVIPGDTVNDVNTILCNSDSTADIATAQVMPIPVCEISVDGKPSEPTASTPFKVDYKASCKNLNEESIALHDLRFSCTDSLPPASITGSFDSNGLFTALTACEYSVIAVGCLAIFFIQ